MKARILVLVTACVFSLAGAMPHAFGAIAFDFETTTPTAVSGYTSVNHTTVYSGGSGYGWLDTTGLDSRRRLISSDPLLNDSVIEVKATHHFRVDLANQAYEVDIVGGDAQFGSYEGFRVSGDGGTTWTFIGRDSSTDDDDLITSGKARPYTYKYDSLTADWNRVAADPELFSVPAGQYLQGKDIPVTVTVGYLLISGGSTIADSGASYINAVEITEVPEPAALSLLGFAIISLALRRGR